MLSICMHEWSHLLSPLIDGRINNILLQTVLDINYPQLQLTDANSLITVLVGQ